MPQNVLGCDLARGWIDIHDLAHGRAGRIANDPGAIAAWLDTTPADSLVVFEATSGCDAPLVAALTARGRPFAWCGTPSYFRGAGLSEATVFPQGVDSLKV